ncbi:g6400 [Coccomyxa viridis]|uniref:G6400 protein n=1 Tax=Coccomyxa viridis TaxID=1274662 RepID=A0ABP1FVB7_9CHLO
MVLFVKGAAEVSFEDPSALFSAIKTFYILGQPITSTLGAVDMYVVVHSLAERDLYLSTVSATSAGMGYRHDSSCMYVRPITSQELPFEELYAKINRLDTDNGAGSVTDRPLISVSESPKQTPSKGISLANLPGNVLLRIAWPFKVLERRYQLFQSLRWGVKRMGASTLTLELRAQHNTVDYSMMDFIHKSGLKDILSDEACNLRHRDPQYDLPTALG